MKEERESWKLSETSQSKLLFFFPFTRVYSVSFPVIGGPFCCICVFHRIIDTEVHCSLSVGISDHLTFRAPVSAETKQEADFHLLASRRE